MQNKNSTVSTPYLFLAPWLLLFTVFGLFPMLYSFYLSFTRYTMLNPDIEWLGIANYVEVLQDPEFVSALLHTLVFAIGTIPFTTAFALIIALLINNKIPFEGIVQEWIFYPVGYVYDRYCYHLFLYLCAERLSQ